MLPQSFQPATCTHQYTHTHKCIVKQYKQTEMTTSIQNIKIKQILLIVHNYENIAILFYMKQYHIYIIRHGNDDKDSLCL